MSSQDDKALIAEHTDTQPGDWKRVKKMTFRGRVYRVFENKALALIVVDQEIHPGGEMAYMLDEFEDGVMAMFTPVSYMEGNDGAHYDGHWGDILNVVYSVPEWITSDEVCENTFVVDGTLEDAVAALDALGMKRVSPGE